MYGREFLPGPSDHSRCHRKLRGRPPIVNRLAVFDALVKSHKSGFGNKVGKILLFKRCPLFASGVRC